MPTTMPGYRPRKFTQDRLLGPESGHSFSASSVSNFSALLTVNQRFRA